MKPEAKGVWITAILLGFFLSAGLNVRAQDSDIENLRDQLNNDYFSVGALLQTTGEYQPEG